MYRLDAGQPAAPRSNLRLGLYITERIVAAHAGTIVVESSTERGTTFMIRLPKRAPIRSSLNSIEPNYSNR